MTILLPCLIKWIPFESKSIQACVLLPISQACTCVLSSSFYLIQIVCHFFVLWRYVFFWWPAFGKEEANFPTRPCLCRHYPFCYCYHYVFVPVMVIFFFSVNNITIPAMYIVIIVNVMYFVFILHQLWVSASTKRWAWSFKNLLNRLMNLETLNTHNAKMFAVAENCDSDCSHTWCAPENDMGHSLMAYQLLFSLKNDTFSELNVIRHDHHMNGVWPSTKALTFKAQTVKDNQEEHGDNSTCPSGQALLPRYGKIKLLNAYHLHKKSQYFPVSSATKVWGSSSAAFSLICSLPQLVLGKIYWKLYVINFIYIPPKK